jgi:hypothetical protein
MPVIVVLLFIASAAFLSVRLRSGEMLSFETTADPQRVITALLGLLVSERRWQTVSQSEHGAHFVHISLTRRRESLAVSVQSSRDGTLVRVASNGRGGKAVGRALRRRVEFSAALGTCVNAVSRRAPSMLHGSARPAPVAIISEPEIPLAEIAIDATVPLEVWSANALDDPVLVAQDLHS